MKTKTHLKGLLLGAVTFLGVELLRNIVIYVSLIIRNISDPEYAEAQSSKFYKICLLIFLLVAVIIPARKTIAEEIKKRASFLKANTIFYGIIVAVSTVFYIKTIFQDIGLYAISHFIISYLLYIAAEIELIIAFAVNSKNINKNLE